MEGDGEKTEGKKKKKRRRLVTHFKQVAASFTSPGWNLHALKKFTGFRSFC